MELAGVRVGADRLLGGDAAPTARRSITAITEFATTALCVQEAGACAAALELTAEYTKTRVQFDKPIATFQAVGQRAADAYVDTEAIRLTAWQAASRLAAGLPAASEVAVAKYWAAEGGQRVVHAASHLHGGVGVDRDYPLHRYFLLTRQIELTLGGANESLRRLGRDAGRRARLSLRPGGDRPALRRGVREAEAVAGQEHARLLVARVGAGQRVEGGGVVRVRQVGHLVDQHGVEHPLGHDAQAV